MSAGDAPTPLPFGRLLLCGAGGISVALLPAWVVWIRQHFALEVRVVVSRGAEALVSPKALAVLTGSPVHGSDERTGTDPSVTHLELARWADAVLVAPATANLLGKLAAGMADDLLTTVLLATEAPVALAPALPPEMARKPAVQRALSVVAEDGYALVPTVRGLESATGTLGAEGAMADAPTALAALKRHVVARTREVAA